MFDIPVGKALVPVEDRKGIGCRACIFNRLLDYCRVDREDHPPCSGEHREDGIDVTYKMVDYLIL